MPGLFGRMLSPRKKDNEKKKVTGPPPTGKFSVTIEHAAVPMPAVSAAGGGGGGGATPTKTTGYAPNTGKPVSVPVVISPYEKKPTIVATSPSDPTSPLIHTTKGKVALPKPGKLTTTFDPFAKRPPPGVALPGVVTPDAKLEPKKKIDIFEPVKQEQDTQTEKAKSAVVTPMSVRNQDWDFLYTLSIQFDNLKAHDAEEAKKYDPNRPEASSSPETSAETTRAALKLSLGGNFTSNGKFLTNEFIGKYFVENKKSQFLIFDFTNQTRLFSTFSRKNQERRNICSMFVDAIINHPRASEITSLQMANSLLPDEFLEALANKCMENPTRLSNLMVINMETNLLEKEGVMALANAIADPKTWPRLQIIKLENQKRQIHFDAETDLGNAIIQSPSLVVVSLTVRDGLARQQINNTVGQNIDNIREARRIHAKKTGTLKDRKRNEMEQFFDRIAANDPTITDVDIVGDIKYLGLKEAERTKTATAFAINTHVRNVKMVKLKLDDNFAAEFSKAIAQNKTLQKVIIDSNDITGTGIKALFEGLGKNTSIVEFQVRHQYKAISSADEQALFELLSPNTTVTKIGVDLRDKVAKMQIERKANETREHQRKLRAAANK